MGAECSFYSISKFLQFQLTVNVVAVIRPSLEPASPRWEELRWEGVGAGGQETRGVPLQCALRSKAQRLCRGVGAGVRSPGVHLCSCGSMIMYPPLMQHLPVSQHDKH